MPFPPTWPVFIPKDKLANWFESYVDSLDLNFWTGTELAGGSYDSRERRWTVTLRRSDGTKRILKPRHLIIATGVGGIPIWPSVPGLDDFAGTVMHSGSYTSGEAWKGRKNSCSAPATAATMSRRIFAPAALRLPWSSAARPMS